jgi:hypothetical protein
MRDQVGSMIDTPSMLSASGGDLTHARTISFSDEAS